MDKIYLIPVIRRGHPIYRIPKYFWHSPSGYEGLPELENVRQGHQLTHKLEDLYVLIANLDATQEAALLAQPDVIAIQDLDNTIPNITVRDIIRSYLEAVSIPSQWVVVGMSYRIILRVVIGLWRFRAIIQHFAGHRIFLETLNLDKTIGELSTEMRDALAATSDALDLDYSSITGLTTIREMLYIAGQQFATIEYQLGSITI